MFFFRSRITLATSQAGKSRVKLTSQACLKHLFFLFAEFTNFVDLLDTVWAKLDLGREEIHALVFVQWAIDEGAFDNALLALRSLQQALSEPCTSHGHGKSGRACTILGLDDFVTTELDAVDQGVELLAGDIGVAGLRDQGDDGNTRVTTNNGDVLVCGIGSLDLGNEAGGADDVQCGDTKESLGVVDSGALVHLGADGHGRVDL